MSNFYNAMTNKDTYTENGMPTNSTSGNEVVDLFFIQGASRQAEDKLMNAFNKALYSNPQLTMKSMFYCRDIRGGQGERKAFRLMFAELCKTIPALAKKVMHLVPEYGRWDDLFIALDYEETKQMALQIIAEGIRQRNGLLAKWLPREGKKNYMKYGDVVRRYLRLNQKAYRKMLVELTSVVENQMCLNRWDKINFEQIPSVAHNKYRKAILKHDPIRYRLFLEQVKNGTAKINASAIFPSDIVKKVLAGDEVGIVEQWNALDNYVPEGKKFLPVCDVSGSMEGEPMNVCISLGVYLSERNISPFKDMFFTFSEEPQLIKLAGTVVQRIKQLRTATWGFNTNLEKLFRTLLSKAVASALKQEDMPDYLIILSDMQFDQATGHPTDSAFEMIKRNYKEAGYEMPQIIFWNLRTSEGIPVKYDEHGVALVSGYSPSIMRTALGTGISPTQVMLDTLNQPRYDLVSKALEAK